jgi:hypothetical protein
MTKEQEREMEEAMVAEFEANEFGKYALESDALDHSIGGGF